MTDQQFIRPNRARGLTVQFLLLALFILHVIYSGRSFDISSKIRKYYDYDSFDRLFSDPIMIITGILSFFVYILCIIFFLRWFKQAYFNLGRLGFKRTHSNNWSVGAWFIPVYQWIGPIRMFTELYKKTEARLVENKLAVKSPSRYIIVYSWWILYIGGGVLSIFGYTIENDFSTYDNTMWLLDFYLFGNILNLLLTMAIIAVIQNYRVLESKLPQIETVSLRVKEKEENEIIDSAL